MLSLIEAINHDSEPETSIEDALKTMQLVEAVVKSREEGKLVFLNDET